VESARGNLCWLRQLYLVTSLIASTENSHGGGYLSPMGDLGFFHTYIYVLQVQELHLESDPRPPTLIRLPCHDIRADCQVMP